MTEVQKLAKFVSTRKYSDLSETAIRELKIRLLDSIACAIGALEGEPVKMIKEQIDALAKVPTSQRKGLIIHTDRGVQYTAGEYKRFLKRRGITHSMAHYAWENAYCERFHRTIKHNYLKFYKMNTFKELQQGVAKAVKMYNRYKPHRNLPARMSPEQFIQAQKEGRYADYTVKIWSKLTSTKMLNVN